jgi:hypothetical protein
MRMFGLSRCERRAMGVVDACLLVVGQPRSLTERKIAPPGHGVELLDEFLARQRLLVRSSAVYPGEHLASGVVCADHHAESRISREIPKEGTTHSLGGTFHICQC